MKTISKLSLALLAVAPLAALAQPQKGIAPMPVPTEGGGVTIGNAPGGTTTYDEARGLAHLTKDVVVTQKAEDVVMYAQDATYNRVRNMANASGQLRVETRDSTIRGKLLFADFNARRATITGDVVITSHGKNDGVAAGFRGEAQKKPIKITADRVDWDYDTHQAIITGNIKITQGVNSGTCESIFYDEAKNIVQLRGRSFFGDNRNRTFLGQDLLIYIDAGTVTSKEPVRIKFKEGDEMMNGAAPAATRRPKTTVSFPAAPKLPQGVIDDVVSAPPLPTPRSSPTATEEPLPTPRPDDVTDATPTAASTN